MIYIFLIKYYKMDTLIVPIINKKKYRPHTVKYDKSLNYQVKSNYYNNKYNNKYNYENFNNLNVPKTTFGKKSNHQNYNLKFPIFATPRPHNFKNINTKKNENISPWIYRNPDYNNNLPIINGITPLGKTAKVPTATKDNKTLKIPKIPATPRKRVFLNIKKEDEEDIPKIDPILGASIYLDFSKDKKKKTSEHMRNISNNTSIIQKQFDNKFIDLIDVEGIVDNKTFEMALDIYENNQVYYQNLIDNNQLTNIENKLRKLEDWFMLIIEPKPKDKKEYNDWIDREKLKINKHKTSYCDPELYPFLNKIPSNVIDDILKYHKLTNID